jgi:hypothetical protein
MCGCHRGRYSSKNCCYICLHLFLATQSLLLWALCAAWRASNARPLFSSHARHAACPFHPRRAPFCVCRQLCGRLPRVSAMHQDGSNHFLAPRYWHSSPCFCVPVTSRVVASCPHSWQTCQMSGSKKVSDLQRHGSCFHLSVWPIRRRRSITKLAQHSSASLTTKAARGVSAEPMPACNDRQPCHYLRQTHMLS